jgi:hypothetical protein
LEHDVKAVRGRWDHGRRPAARSYEARNADQIYEGLEHQVQVVDQRPVIDAVLSQANGAR